MNIKSSFKKIIITVIFSVSLLGFNFPIQTALADTPQIAWSNTSPADVTETSPGEFTIIGHLEVTGISPTGSVVSLVVFSDDDGEFDPYDAMGNQGPVQNGEIDFVYGGSSANTYFLAVLVSDTWNGQQFLPFDPQPFIVSVGQVASPGGGGGGGSNPTDPNDPNTGDPNNPNNPNNPNTGNPNNPTNEDGSSASVNAWPTQAVINNPLAVDSIEGFIVGLLNALLKVGIPIMVIFLVYSGMRIVMARGNEKELADAKKNLLWVIIGVAILLSAWTIVKVLKGTLEQIDISLIKNLVNYFV